MTTAKRRMKLGMFMRPAGHHIAAWRLPDNSVHAPVRKIAVTEPA